MTHDELINLATDVFKETSTTRHPPGMHPRRWEWLKELASGVLQLNEVITRNTKRIVDAGIGCAPNDEPYLLTGAVTLALCEIERWQAAEAATAVRLNKQLAELQDQQETDTATIGILADVVDALWEDDSRCLNHGYGDVVAKAKEVVALANKKPQGIIEEDAIIELEITNKE